jgi:hypothetical protein
LKFFQFLMLFENQFLDTSSNFGAPIKDSMFHTGNYRYNKTRKNSLCRKSNGYRSYKGRMVSNLY